MKQKLVSFLLLLALMGGLTIPSPTVFADGSGSITLSANKSTVAAGSSLVIAIYMNGGGTPIYGVESDLSYPASQLQYVGFSSTGSAFEISAVNGGGDGLATIARGTTSPVSGSALVGTATFRALASSGNATISIGGSSSLAKGDGTPLQFSAGATSIKFGAVTAPVTSATPHAGPAVSATPAPAPPKDTTPPVITNPKIKTVTPYSLVISWMTNKPADSTVDYGVDVNYGLTVSRSTIGTEHEVTLNSAFLTPKLLLHYRLKSTDSAGNVQTGTDQTVQLPGVAVTIIVRAENGKPQSDAVVTLDDQTMTTDSHGQATLHSSLGNKQVTITYNGETVRKPITIARASKPLPPYQLDLAKQPLNHWMLTSIGLLVLVLTLLGIDAALFGSAFIMRLVHRKHRSSVAHAQLAGTTASGSAAAIDVTNSSDASAVHRDEVAPYSKPSMASDAELTSSLDSRSASTIGRPHEQITSAVDGVDQTQIDALEITRTVPASPQATRIVVTDQTVPETAVQDVSSRLKQHDKSNKPAVLKIARSKKSAPIIADAD